MKKHIALLIVGLFSFSSLAYAKDDVSDYSIQDALKTEQAKLKLGSDVKFYFGTQPHGEIVKDLGEFKTNKKTNAFNKTDLESCQWVFLSAMIALKDRAVKEGGNAVVDIKSNYKNNLTTSNATFQCGAGTFVSGVALTGKVVKLK